MTDEADRLLTHALKTVDLRGGFSPAELGAKVGLSKIQAETAARLLANAGVLVLGFDQSAEFSDDYRKMRSPAVPKATKPAKSAKPAKAKRAKRAARQTAQA
jgi:RNase P/RNase MRP subunit p30